MKRRNFLKNSGLATAGALSAPIIASCNDAPATAATATVPVVRPIVICTWDFHNASAKAWEVLHAGGTALDAVEAGVKVEEDDVDNQTVGTGGRPDRDGNVTLDACIMDHAGNCGAVLALQHMANPISVARKVMEDTPHVMLVGQGAEQFAYEKGFQRTELLTEK
jgi:N4-(beta-N-acetylglucosaminyl)-L-asparaginase